MKFYTQTTYSCVRNDTAAGTAAENPYESFHFHANKCNENTANSIKNRIKALFLQFASLTAFFDVILHFLLD